MNELTPELLDAVLRRDLSPRDVVPRDPGDEPDLPAGDVVLTWYDFGEDGVTSTDYAMSADIVDGRVVYGGGPRNA